MPPSLGSMTSQCLQQRDGYPYMFTDPLHSLSSPYGTHPSRTACNPTAAHQQSHYSTSNGGSATGKSKLTSMLRHRAHYNQFNEGVITAGVSVPIQIPSQGPDIGTNYWPRLQWSSFFGLPTLGENFADNHCKTTRTELRLSFAGAGSPSSSSNMPSLPTCLDLEEVSKKIENED